MKGKLRIRRLTLPPGAELQPTAEDDISDARRILDQERLARGIEVMVATSSRPGPHIHGVEDRKGSRFWALSSDDSGSDEDDTDTNSIDTPEFERKAMAAGFTSNELVQAGNDEGAFLYEKLGE